MLLPKRPLFDFRKYLQHVAKDILKYLSCTDSYGTKSTAISNVWQHTKHTGFYKHGQRGSKASVILMGSEVDILRTAQNVPHETRIRRAPLCWYVCSCEVVGNTHLVKLKLQNDTFAAQLQNYLRCLRIQTLRYAEM
jgi:hypothetical protein